MTGRAEIEESRDAWRLGLACVLIAVVGGWLAFWLGMNVIYHGWMFLAHPSDANDGASRVAYLSVMTTGCLLACCGVAIVLFGGRTFRSLASAALLMVVPTILLATPIAGEWILKA